MINKILRFLLPPKKHKLPDGPDGFLWKESDHGGLVVLFPKKFRRPFDKVIVKRGRKKLGRLYYTGKANGDRQHWRSHESISYFGRLPVRVIAYGKRRKHIWRIKDPSGRAD